MYGSVLFGVLRTRYIPHFRVNDLGSDLLTILCAPIAREIGGLFHRHKVRGDGTRLMVSGSATNEYSSRHVIYPVPRCVESAQLVTNFVPCGRAHGNSPAKFDAADPDLDVEHKLYNPVSHPALLTKFTIFLNQCATRVTGIRILGDESIVLVSVYVGRWCRRNYNPWRDGKFTH